MPSKLSPLMEQYYNVKKQYPNAILLFRVGDFFETFGEDAVVVSRDLNIVLTSRQKDDTGNKIPLAGVPYHALDTYLAKLVKSGHKVVICDQVEDPKTAKGLVKRDITRIVTPGTIIEPSMLEERANNFLAAVVQDGDKAGLSFVDVSTGELLTTEIDVGRLRTELFRFSPAECLVATDQSIEGLNVQKLEASFFQTEEAIKVLNGQFKEGWVDRFRLGDKPL
jgi:DNA mismatch repair protein MutS